MRSFGDADVYRTSIWSRTRLKACHGVVHLVPGRARRQVLNGERLRVSPTRGNTRGRHDCRMALRLGGEASVDRSYDLEVLRHEVDRLGITLKSSDAHAVRLVVGLDRSACSDAAEQSRVGNLKRL